MQVMLTRLMSKIEYLIVPKGTKFTGSCKLGLNGKQELNLECGSEPHTMQHLLQCPLLEQVCTA